MSFSVVPMTGGHAEAVLRIYQEGLDTGEASFETTAPEWASFDASHLAEHRFVVVEPDGAVAAWAALSPVSDRCAYAGVAEVSVYVAAARRGRGAGSLALDAVVHSSEAGGTWTLQAGVFPENTASVRLHEKLGFRVVGVRERLGCHRGRWRDVLLLERRSPVVGTDRVNPAPAAR